MTAENAGGNAHRLALLLLLLAAACSNQSPYATTVGILSPGATLAVNVAEASFSAFQPAGGQARDRFTVEATALTKSTPPPAPRIRPLSGRGLLVQANHPLADLLVRVPDGVTLVVNSLRGDVHVTDITGNARVFARQGEVQVMLPGYAEVRAGRGDVSVTMGSTGWPGTLHFSTQQGNIELWINEHAAFNVHLHTGRGTLFTEFDLRGTSQGGSETIDGRVNGGGSHGIDVETPAGEIRLLRLRPQA